MQQTTLKTAELGSTGLQITRVGFGAWAIGGGGWAHGWGEQDDDASVAAIRHAVESGVNWIDTAAVYGLGHSEEVVARALAPYGDADRPYVFTKCGLVWDETDRGVAPRRSGDPTSLRREVDASLRRLRTERIDLYQMHWPAAEPVAEYWAGAAGLEGGGQGPGRRTVQPRPAPARRGRGARPRRFAAAAVLVDQPGRHRRDRLVPRTPHRGHRVQPDAVRAVDRCIHRPAGRDAARRRLAVAGRGIHRRTVAPQPGAGRRAAAGRRPARHHRGHRRGGLVPGPPRGHRRDRRRPRFGPGRRLDRRTGNRTHHP